MRITGIARPGAIYGASAAAQRFSETEMVEFLEEGANLQVRRERKCVMDGGGWGSEHMPDFAEFEIK